MARIYLHDGDVPAGYGIECLCVDLPKPQNWIAVLTFRIDGQPFDSTQGKPDIHKVSMDMGRRYPVDTDVRSLTPEQEHFLRTTIIPHVCVFITPYLS